MKTNSVLRTLAFATLLFVGFNASATIIRVDNNAGNPGTYTSAQAAHDAASAGDTLYFNGSATGYGNMTLTKRLYIYGPGYYLGQNPSTQANTASADLNIVTFNIGSNGSLITGMTFQYMDVNENNIVIKRNYGARNGNSYVLRVGSSKANVLILGNFLYNTYGSCPSCYSGYADYANALWVQGNCSNIVVKSNIILNGNASNTTVSCESNSQVDFGNNIIFGGMYIYNSTVTNNITYQGFVNGSNNSFYNNIGSSTQYGNTNGNQQNVSMSAVFVQTGSTDGYYQLKAGSPAIGAGQAGDDCGAYGGTDAYVLSGLPSIPHVYYFSSPSTGSAPVGLPVTIKIKSQN